jgi:membrane protein involved in colicin uptake
VVIAERHLDLADYQRHEITRLAAEVAQLKAELAAQIHARLTAEIALAVERNDKQAWAKAMAERNHAPEWLATLRNCGAL